MPVTLTAGPPSEPLPCVDKVARTASNIGCRARYTCAGSLATLSALARLLAVVFSRTDCAAMPDPAMSKALKDDIQLCLGWRCSVANYQGWRSADRGTWS